MKYELFSTISPLFILITGVLDPTFPGPVPKHPPRSITGFLELGRTGDRSSRSSEYSSLALLHNHVKDRPELRKAE